jgi:ABC-2 type transport system ATP-binding protein
MIETRELCCRFGDVLAVDRLDLSVAAGDVFGFIGPNGAGKTTTLKILATLLRPSSGDAFVCGASVSSDTAAVRRAIGFVPDHFGLYPDMRVADCLEFFAAALRLPPDRRKGVVRDVLDLTDLAGRAGDLIASLSRGMQQRLSLARSLLHDPKVLLLDEPASGLDPRARVEMRGLIQELARMGKTVLLSSHILWELGALCNRIGIIDRGRLVFRGTLEEARASAFGGKTLSVEVRGQPRKAAGLLRGFPGVKAVARDGVRLIVTLAEGHEDPAPIARALVEWGIPVVAFSDEDLDLERVFRRMMMAPQGGGAAASGEPGARKGEGESGGGGEARGRN